MFKNTDGEPNLQNILEQKTINSIFCSDPFLKAGFISKLVQDTNLPVLYLDLDLLYSGYVESEILPRIKNMELFRPTTDTIYSMIKKILVKTSTTQVMVVIDSLNGFFNMLNREKNIGKKVMSILMLLTSMTQKNGSYIVVSSMVRYTKDEGWILSSTGKRLVETRGSKKIILEYAQDGIEVTTPTTKLIIPSNMIPLA